MVIDKYFAVHLQTKRSVYKMNDSRQHILNTAFGLFLKHTYKDVTLQEIVKQTGLSKGGFYHYFTSKENLFKEVIDHFLANHMIIDYSKFSTGSLIEFYKDCISHTDNKVNRILQTGNDMDVNYYMLIFDAVKILPDIRKKLTDQRANELNAWKKMIREAKKSGEICSQMTDEQIAQCFINMYVGVSLRNITINKSSEIKKEVLFLWSGFYKQLQPESK